MSKEQVMDYVMNSPANTNPNVLSGMLDSVAQSGGTVEVSKIKIATNVGGSNTQVATNLNYMQGGGNTPDRKTIAELIGDKTIIGIYGVSDQRIISVNAYSNLGLGNTNILDATNEVLASTTALNVDALTVSAPNNFDIYAICI